MKNLVNYLFFATLFFAIASCGSTSTDSTDTSTEKQGKEYTSAYICPMHCEGSGSDAPGKCGVCGMDYVKNESAPKTEESTNTSEHNHEGDDHSGHSH